MGARAFSHDSIFIPDGGAESEQTVQAMSQDNILGKVKTLQRQLSKNIKLGQPPPGATPMKRADSGEASLEEDPFPASPMELVTQQDIILSEAENKSSDTPSSPSPPNPPGARSEMEEKAAPAKPSRPKRHFSSAGTIESVNLDAIPLAIARLDNSAAKHKLSVKPKNQRVSKKHRRLGLAGARPNDPGGLASQLSLDQNGHPGEDKLAWHEEEPEPPDSEEEKRRQEEYWRELEAKCKRQKAEAAERRRLEEQRLRALERRLWEENRRQGLQEEAGEGEEREEGEEAEPQPEAGKRQCPEERRRLDEQAGPAPECRPQGAGQWQALEEEAEPLQGLTPRELEARGRREAERLWQEEEEREVKELRRLEELEAQRRQEMEQQRLEEERKRQEEEEEEQRLREEEQRLREEEQRLREEEEQRLREEERKRREEEERKRREEEERKRRQEEEQRQREEEERKRWEEEERKRREEEERKRQEEEQRQREEEENRLKELRRREEEEAKRREELRKRREAEKEPPGARRAEAGGLQTDCAEEPEPLKPAKRRDKAEEAQACEEQGPEAGPPGELQGTRAAARGQDGCAGPGKREEARTPAPQKQEACVAEPPAPERDHRRVEELRWREVEERQTMPRPYTFQVSSGGRQILFPKVNLSPVTPTKDAGPASAPQPPRAPRASAAPHALPAALSIPHTAILVTGAQLCGPAVNLSQIKDTACKSLLGLSGEKKQGDAPTLESPPRARAGGGGKARPAAQEPASSVAALDEWASIRSRILKSSEGDRRSRRDQPAPGDESAPRARGDSRGALRRTPPVNAKFSITPARQKFSDSAAEASKPHAGADGARKRPALGAGDPTAPLAPAAEGEEPPKGQEPADTTEGCKFAKDLPSFLVPSPPDPPQKAGPQAEPVTAWGGEAASGATGKPDPVMPGGEEKASPFGIKLRRTNYSLRFHCDQQAEQKKKKRSSGGSGGSGSPGDGAEGRPPAPESAGGEKEAEAVALTPGPGPPSPAPTAQPPAPEHAKAASRSPVAPKPALAPKPSGQTPPTSPLCKLSRPYLVELLARRPGELCKEAQEGREPGPASPPLPRREEKEEVEAERKAAPPALSAAPQEKPSQTPEAGRKEKPVLQSRHSLDGSRLVEKVETAQPLWITLALQKQKGFREQQATREERKQAREAKQAEKLSKDNVSVSPQPGSSSVSRAGSLLKSTAQPEEKKPETAGSRLERREQLKKANTLPTSVTVEISDSPPPAPLVKEVTKRFSTPDAAPVSTEPAWLALAKRKAKAWSDCPQIIK